MSLFDFEFLTKIRESQNLLDWVSQHVVLKKSGAQWTGLCPFHSERSPSFTVNEVKQLYHCYGCKKGGDLFSFVMEISGLNFHEAVLELAEKASIVAPEGSKGFELVKKGSDEKKLAYRLNRFAAHFFHSRLEQSSPALHYLLKRGVDQGLIQEFYLGLSGSSKECAHFLAEKKAPMDLALQLGLLRKTQLSVNEQAFSSMPHDAFRERILFPILTNLGKIAGFGGRIYQGDPSAPKYINSPESLVYQKSKLFFGLYQAQKFIREKNEVIVVEGYFDVLAMHKAGFKNTVAACGSTLGGEHFKVLKRLASKTLIIFDADSAGIAASEKIMIHGLELGLVVHGINLPASLDPADFLISSEGELKAQAVQTLEQEILNSQPMLDMHLYQGIDQSLQTPERRSQALKKMAELLKHYKDPMGRQARLSYLEKKFGISAVDLGFPSPMVPKKPFLSIQPKLQAKQEGSILLREDFLWVASLAASSSIRAWWKKMSEGLQARVEDFLDTAILATALRSLELNWDQIDQASFWGDALLKVNPLDPQAKLLSGFLSSVGFQNETPLDLPAFQRLCFLKKKRRLKRVGEDLQKKIGLAHSQGKFEVVDGHMKEFLDLQREMKQLEKHYGE